MNIKLIGTRGGAFLRIGLTDSAFRYIFTYPTYTMAVLRRALIKRITAEYISVMAYT